MSTEVKTEEIPEVKTEEIPEVNDPLMFYVDQLTADAKKIIQTEQITTLNVLSICISLMQITERYKGITGEQKKKIVLRVISNYLSEQNGDQSLLGILPDFINTAVSLDKGQVTISMSVDELTSCCLGLCKSLKKQQEK